MLLKKLFLTFILCFASVFGSFATNDDLQYATNVTKKIIDIINNKKLTTDQKKSLFEKDILQNDIDLEWQSRAVAIDFWADLTEEQRDSFRDLYKKYLLNNVIPQFLNYVIKSYKIIDHVEKLTEKDFTASVVIIGESGTDVTIQERVRRYSEGSYKILDLSSEGVSVVSTYRSQFGSCFESVGANGLFSYLKGDLNGCNVKKS